MRRIATACAGCVLALAAHAQESPLTLGAGLHYSSGDYGTGTTTKITTLAGTARYESGPWVYKATVPWLRVQGESSVIPGVGRVRGGTTRQKTESGLGDIVLSATYNFYYDKVLGIDGTAKLKVPTADEEKGLGTGEADAIFLLEPYRTFDRLTAFGSIGYHILGDAPGQPLDNVWSVGFGGTYKLDERDSVGASLDYRQRVVPGGDPQRELTGFLVRKLDRFWKAQLYALIGLSDGSPDYGFGASLARPF